MRTVLHITAHMGGGVGRVVTSLIDRLMASDDRYEHEVASFEYINESCLAWARSRGVRRHDEVSPTSADLHRKVRQADLVHLHFWNHPAAYHFLSSFSGQEARLLMWSHVNGHHAPYEFNRGILKFPELFVVASPYSMEAPAMKSLAEDYRRRHVRCIFSTAGTGAFSAVEPAPHHGFNVGYVGTVDYAKLHPEFLDVCARVNLPNLKFIVCGGTKHREMEMAAKDRGLSRLFDFRGQIADVSAALAAFDVFGYPLGPRHYGTGEQVLIEAMAAGVPQVVLDNGPERYVVKDGVTGIVARNVQEYVEAIEKLYADRTLRLRLSYGSREYARGIYSIEKAAQQWLDVYDELLEREKKPCLFEVDRLPKSDHPAIPVELFLTALGDCPEAELFRELLNMYPVTPDGRVRERIEAMASIFKSQTRGSAAHYSRHFGDCEKLRFLGRLTQGELH